MSERLDDLERIISETEPVIDDILSDDLEEIDVPDPDLNGINLPDLDELPEPEPLDDLDELFSDFD